MGDSVTTKWPPERIDALAELWAEGLSCSKIAEALNDRFGCRLTRNAVIGKVHRSGMPRRSAAVKIANNRAAATARREKRGLRENFDAAMILKRQATAPRPLPEPPPVADASFAKPWMERGFGECTWIIAGTGAEAVACCAPVHAFGWCKAHHRIGTKPSTYEQRRELSRLARWA